MTVNCKLVNGKFEKSFDQIENYSGNQFEHEPFCTEIDNTQFWLKKETLFSLLNAQNINPLPKI